MKAPFRAERLQQAPSLSSTLVAKLREEIASNFEVGERFPTDAEISSAFGVSRTVVREAVAALRAEGLLTTERGRGSFVTSRVPSQPFVISREEIKSLDDVLRIYELRSALESEAAMLAARRRTRTNLRAISAAMKKLDQAIEQGADALQEDTEFHFAIAEATQNEYFTRVLGSFGSSFIARRIVRSDLDTPELLKSHLENVRVQHGLIAEAIRQGDAETASRVMRQHLDSTRYRKLLETGKMAKMR